MKHHPFHDWGHHEPYGQLPPFRFWLQTSLPAIYDDSLTYIELAGRLHWYIDQIINTLKVYDDKFCELMGLYDELEEYVRCYFDHANFPDMVKDILDDMAATGHLSEILVDYIKDFSFDPKKIKGGIVPVHYVYDHTENGIEYFKRTESDEEVLTILRNGSIVLGVFKDSPSNGSFISYMKRANFVYNGTVKEFECGCVNTVYTKDFTITYEDYVRDADDFIRSVVITDHYGDDTFLEIYPVNADLPDGYVTTVKLADNAVTTPKIADNAVTTPKIADKAVTHPKLADDAVWSNNIKDGEVKTNDLADASVTEPKLADNAVSTRTIQNASVTEPKLADNAVSARTIANNAISVGKLADNAVITRTIADGSVTPAKLEGTTKPYILSQADRKYIFIGDSYGAGQGLSNANQSWIGQVAEIMGLQKNTNYWSSAISGAGFTAGTTFKSQLQTILGSLNAAQKSQITDVVVLGGWNDGSTDVTNAVGQFLSTAKGELPYANYHLGYISWEDSSLSGGNKLSRSQGAANYAAAAAKYGIGYIGNIEYVMHDYSLFNADGIHPNVAGNAAIAGALATYLRGGTVHAISGFRVDDHVAWDSNVTPDSSSAIVSTWRDNNICGMFTSHTHFKFTNPVTFSGHPSSDSHGQGWTKLFDFGDKGFIQDNGFHGFNDCVNVTLYDGSVYKDYPCWIQIRGNGLYMCPISAAGQASSNPYAPISGITDAIFQVGSLTLDGWCMYG